MANPFMSPDEDSDILDENPAASNPDTKSNSAGYQMHGVAGKELPDELRDKMQSTLGIGAPTIVGKTNTPEAFLVTASILGYLSKVNFSSEPNVTILAVAEVLDEQTDGRVSQFVRFRLAEKKVLVAHEIKKFCNNILTWEGSATDLEFWSEFLTYIELLLAFQEFMISHYSAQYTAMAEAIGKEVDESFLATGIKTTRTELERLCMRPRAEREA